MTIPDHDLDRLYELPLDDFTAERNELAKQLRSRGDRDAADEVRGLRKPSQAAWALNQVARRDPGGVKRLLAAGEALRDAQEGVVSGERDAADLRDAVEDERAAVAPLLEEAGRTLGERGRPANQQLLERVRETLRAAAGNEEVAGRLRTGRLVDDHQAMGLGPFTVAPGAAPARKRKKAVKGEEAKERPRSRRRTRAPAKPAAPSAADRRLKQRITEAKKRLRAAEKDADRARRELAATEKDRERAELAFRSADRASEEARGRAEGAAAEVQRLRAEVAGLEA